MQRLLMLSGLLEGTNVCRKKEKWTCIKVRFWPVLTCEVNIGYARKNIESINIKASWIKGELEDDLAFAVYSSLMLSSQFAYLCLCRVAAHNKEELCQRGITHILNAAHNAWGSKGNQTFYGAEFSYYGIAAEDSVDFDLSSYFHPASEYIHQALRAPKGESPSLQRCFSSLAAWRRVDVTSRIPQPA